MAGPTPRTTVTLINAPAVGMRMTCHEVCDDGLPELGYFEEIHEVVSVTWLSASRNYDAVVTTRLVSSMAEMMSEADKAMRFDWVFCPSGVKNSRGDILADVQLLSINCANVSGYACLLPATTDSLNWFTRNRFCALTGAFEAREEIIDAIPTSVMAQALDAIEQAAIARAASKPSVPDTQPGQITVLVSSR